MTELCGLPELPKFCLAPRSDKKPGICGKKLRCRGHPDQTDYVSAFPKVMIGVCEKSIRGGICGQYNCEKHNKPQKTHPKKKNKKQLVDRNKQPQSRKQQSRKRSRSIVKNAEDVEPVYKKTRLVRQDATVGVLCSYDALAKQYQDEIDEAREQIRLLEKKIETRLSDIRDLKNV